MFAFVTTLTTKVKAAYASFAAKFKADIAAGKNWAVYAGGVGNAALHGGWSSLTAVASASVLDSSKFNVTNGLKSEFDLLFLVFLSSGTLAGYLYVKANKAPAL